MSYLVNEKNPAATRASPSPQVARAGERNAGSVPPSPAGAAAPAFILANRDALNPAATRASPSPQVARAGERWRAAMSPAILFKLIASLPQSASVVCPPARPSRSKCKGAIVRKMSVFRIALLGDCVMVWTIITYSLIILSVEVTRSFVNSSKPK